MQQKALLIIDVQEAVVQDAPYRTEKLISNIKDLKQKAVESRIPVLYVRHDGGVGDALEAGTDGWQIYHEVEREGMEPVFDKKYNSAFKETGLKQYLEMKKITDLIIVGLQTEYCIDTTIKSAFEIGYSVIVPKGATSSFDNLYLKAKELVEYYEEEIWKDRFAKVLPVQEVIEMMECD